MSRENRLPDYLERIREEAEDACRFVEGLRKEDFLGDGLRRDAVLVSLIAIGGILNRTGKRYPEFFSAYPEFPWLHLRDTCNDILENCLEPDLDRAWSVAQVDLPKLLAILPSIDADSWASKAVRVRGGNHAMKPSAVFNRNRQVIREAAARRKTVNPRVFGSVLRGEDTEASDLDILVDAPPGTTLLDICGLQVDLEELLGVKVDVLTSGGLPQKWREEVLAEALPV